MVDTQFVSDKFFIFDYDLDLGRGNLKFVHDKFPHFDSVFYEACFSFLNSLFSYG